MQFIDQQKLAKYWLPVEINFYIQDSAEYPLIFKHCPHISKCLKQDSQFTGQTQIIQRPDKKPTKYQFVGIGLSVNDNTKSPQT